MGEGRCEIRTASDGTVVRVNGSIDQETLDMLAAKVRALVDSRCDDPSPFPMPEIAQRFHGRETYLCGAEKDHDGDHRWPDEPDAKWTWPAAQSGDGGDAAAGEGSQACVQGPRSAEHGRTGPGDHR